MLPMITVAANKPKFVANEIPTAARNKQIYTIQVTIWTTVLGTAGHETEYVSSKQLQTVAILFNVYEVVHSLCLEQ